MANKHMTDNELAAQTEPAEPRSVQRMVRHREAVALAKATWAAAKGADMYHDDLVSCCAILIANVADKTGEPLDYLTSEVARRASRIMPNAKAEAPSLSEVDPPAAG